MVTARIAFSVLMLTVLAACSGPAATQAGIYTQAYETAWASLPPTPEPLATPRIAASGTMALFDPPAMDLSACKSALKIGTDDIGKQRCVFGAALALDRSWCSPERVTQEPSYNCGGMLHFWPPGPKRYSWSSQQTTPTGFYLYIRDYIVEPGQPILAVGIVLLDTRNVPWMRFPLLYHCPPTLFLGSQ